MLKELDAARAALKDLQDKYVEELRAARAEAYKQGYAVGFTDAHKNYRNAGVWAKDGSMFHTYRNESLNGETMFIYEPKSSLTDSKAQP